MLNDRYAYSRLRCSYHYSHQSSSATLNLQPSSVLQTIPNIVPVSFFSPFYKCGKSCINKKKRCGPEPCPQCRQRPAANAFVKKHINQINSNTVISESQFPTQRPRHSATQIYKKIRVRSNDKLVIVNVDWDLFGRLLIITNTRQICLKNILSFEISLVPYSLASVNGSFRKGTKSVFCSDI